ncbi:MAG: hypothetical protein K2X90_01570 [Candidatus Babeliaceae bacterium]|nr:hypothetical protein [Candidatus Babeliaceae bacterium]
MKKIVYLIISISMALLGTDCSKSIGKVSLCTQNCNPCFGSTVLIKQPTYDNTMLYYGQKYAHHYTADHAYGGTMFALEYQRSFNSSKLAQGMFGAETLFFAGSQVANPVANSLLADNFGLSQDFVGALAFSPVIQDVNLHFDWFVETKRGFYLQFDMNFTHESRNLNAQYVCNSIQTTTALFPAGYMSTSESAPITDLKTALMLQKSFGDKNKGTIFGRFDFCNRTKNGLAGLSLNIGYDALRCNNYVIGGFFRFVAPTGTAVNPHYVFDPVIGNGKGWELGIGIDGRWHLWDKDDNQQLTLMLDGYVTTVLPHHSLRTFDLRSSNSFLNFNCSQSCSSAAPCPINVDLDYLNSCASTSDSSLQEPYRSSGSNCDTSAALNFFTRYLLLKEFTLLDGIYSYAHNLIAASDFTTRKVRVSVPAKGDATLRVVYTNKGFDAALGYSIFGMMRERISRVSGPSDCLFTQPTSVYAVKGCQGVAYNSYTYGTITPDTIDPLSSTNPASVPLVNSANFSTAYTVGGCGPVDNAFIIQNSSTVYNAAWNSNNNNNTITGGASVPALEPYQILAKSSGQNGDQLIILQNNAGALDLCSGTAPEQIVQKGFFSLDYTWLEHAWAPYIGFMVEVEGAQSAVAVDQWGLVFRGGFAY